MQSLSHGVKRYLKRPETRLSLGLVSNGEAARRLAELDAEKYGWSNVRAQGTREQPFYSNSEVLALRIDELWEKRLSFEAKLQKLTSGSNLVTFTLANTKQDPDELLSITKEIVGNYPIGLYVFKGNLTFCLICQKRFYGEVERCPSCGSVNSLQYLNRVADLP